MAGNTQGPVGVTKTLPESLREIANAKGVSLAELGVDDVAGELTRRRASAMVRTMINGNIPEVYGAIRVGKWKLITGYPGRGDWYGTDPTETWLGDYIVGAVVGVGVGRWALGVGGGVGVAGVVCDAMRCDATRRGAMRRQAGRATQRNTDDQKH